MKFRQATIADIPAMSAIRLEVRENALSNPAKITQQMYEDYLSRLGRGWICELDGKVIGFSYADRTNHSIWALFVSPPFEGQGAGKGLLKLATDWLFAVGAAKIILKTGVNTRAERFYHAQGWVRGSQCDEVEVEFTLNK